VLRSRSIPVTKFESLGLASPEGGPHALSKRSNNKPGININFFGLLTLWMRMVLAFSSLGTLFILKYYARS
jgi:hypothetical protein